MTGELCDMFKFVKFVRIWIEAHTDLFLMCVLKMLEMGNSGGLRV